MKDCVVALVGRPNVGKSTLFNRLIGKRISIVDDTPGVTRDRIYGKCEWSGKNFSLIDTGGIEEEARGTISSMVKEQADSAIASADVLVFVTDNKSGLLPKDQEIAVNLKKVGKPIILCVNKCDTVGAPNANFYEFYNLGLGDPIQVSSVHGYGTGDLLDKVINELPKIESLNDESEILNIAIIGKPNVGKSSLVNVISGTKRCIVSDTSGTTRDTTDTEIVYNKNKYNLIDTAGIRRKSRVKDAIEKYSVMRAKLAVERSDICIIMIDAQEGITEQDTRIAGFAHESGKGCIIAVNKWDSVDKDNNTMSEYRKKIEKDLAFMSYAPIIFISAATGQRIKRLFPLIDHVANSATMRISTGMLNDIITQCTTRVQPPTDKGKRLKIYYVTQVNVKPPCFVFFVNIAELFHFSYQRYIENCLRNTFGLEGTPVKFIIREKKDKNQ